MGEGIDPEQLKKAEAMFSDWTERDQNESPIVTFIERARQSHSLAGAKMVLHALPQMHSDSPQAFFEKVDLAGYFLGQIAGVFEKQREGAMEPLVERGRLLMEQLAEEGMDAADLLILSGLLVSSLLYAIAKTYVDAGRLEP